MTAAHLGAVAPGDTGPRVPDDHGVTTGIELVRPPTLSASAPYAYAAVTDPGRMVFTAGACPLDGVRA